jgi:hypothetical protein
MKVYGKLELFRQYKGLSFFESIKLNLYYFICLNTDYKYVSYNKLMKLINKLYKSKGVVK